MRPQYAEAINDLTTTPYSEKNFRDPQRKLAEHLFAMYWRGRIKLDDPLLVAFWEKAEDALRGHIMNFIGINLRSDKQPLTPELEARLHELWNDRVADAITAPDKTPYQEEMSGFGSWFESAKFDEEWVCVQYLKALDFGVKTRIHHFTADALVDMVSRRPLLVLQILKKLIDLNQSNWVVIGNRGKIITVLRTTLQSLDTQTQKLAREITSRLAARGHSEYADLLKEFPESPNLLLAPN